MSNRPYIEQWATRVAQFLNDGVTTYMMIHYPNNLHCPSLARDFHNALRGEAPGLGLPPLAPWPVPQQQEML